MLQQSRREVVCHYCGIEVNKHNLKAHTALKHPNENPKERLSGQKFSFVDFMQNTGAAHSIKNANNQKKQKTDNYSEKYVIEERKPDGDISEKTTEYNVNIISLNQKNRYNVTKT